MTILTYVQNIWQIGYVVQSLLMGYNRYSSDIEWHDYKQHDFVPKYSPPQNTERNYSPELLAILTAMLQCKVDARPTAQEVMKAIKKDMYRFTQGMERWGTNEWFEELDRGDVDSSVDESIISESAPLRGGSSLKNAAENLFEEFKYLLCIPTARPKHRRTPIDRAISPASAAKARAKAASRKRRRDIVVRQISEGLGPDLQSTDPADDIFVLEDDLKIKHPQRGDSARIDYFDAQDPVSTTYREDIDDVEKFVVAKKAHEALERGEPGNEPSVGVESYDFRKDGHTPGEIVYPKN